MKNVEITQQYDANITQMREGDAFGNGDEELRDGNMIPRLCEFAGTLSSGLQEAIGSQACAKTCQLKALKSTQFDSTEVGNKLATEAADTIEQVGKQCAENNILEKLAEMYIKPENFVMVAATKDRVIFGDQIDASGAVRHADGYTMVPEANGFFFRPGVDMTPNRHRRIFETTMRMADCGDVVVAGQDEKGKDFVGQGHFSRTNMRGPSAYTHVLNGEKVSWGEYFIGSGVEHFNADVSKMTVKLVAAVEGKDFLHHYEDDAARDAHFPGWNELGFMHYTGNYDEKGRKECRIDYREMIVWQLTKGISNPKYRLTREQVAFEDAINTGDINLGHASHHKATHGEIAHGRDMYLVGFNKREAVAARIAEVSTLQAGREWTMRSFPEMSDKDYHDFANLVSAGNRELSELYAVQQSLADQTSASPIER